LEDFTVSNTKDDTPSTGFPTFERLESEVRGYCRSFPVMFNKAQGSYLFDQEGKQYIDFLMGAGTLNYGHNNPLMKKALIDYIQADGLVHGLDMYSKAKERFLEVFEQFILKPREFEYKVQFTGPTGTNAVEAALKLARRCTGRTNIVAFTNAFHGVTLGSVAATANEHFRNAAGINLGNITHVPYCNYMGDEMDSLAYLRQILEDKSSGLDDPAAILVETVQGEGGINVASAKWLRGLERICRDHDILLIVDDIQMGCGRTGSFFSFEEAGITPDIITLSKSLSGYGLPFSVVLMKPELDQWEPGEHNGTFRGNNLAFVTSAEMLSVYWRDNTFSKRVREKGELMAARLRKLQEKYDWVVDVRGRGMVWGVEVSPPALSEVVTKAAFQGGLIIETSGSEDQVVKFLPCLAIDTPVLEEGLSIVEDAFAFADRERAAEASADGAADSSSDNAAGSSADSEKVESR